MFLANIQEKTFLAPQDAQEVTWVTHSALADFTDVTLVSDPVKYMKMKNTSEIHFEKCYLVMKVMIVNEVVTCDLSPVAMFIMEYDEFQA